MKRSFLEEFGLDKEAVDKIIAENGSDIENAKENAKTAAERKFTSEKETLQGQIADLQGQVTQRDADLSKIQTQLSAAKENADKLTEAQESLKGLQSKYDTERQAWEQKNAQQAYEFAVRERANALEFSSTAAKREFIREAIGKGFKMEKDSLLGFDDYVKVYKESDPGAFKAQQPETPPASPEDPKKPDIVLPGNSGTPGKGKSLEDMMKAKNANPDMVISFGK